MNAPATVKWAMPDHTMLPETDGKPVENSLERPQIALLTDAIRPLLERLHPDGQYFLGQDVGIYWRYTDPPLEGCRAPDWYYVPGVPPTSPDGSYRRSYVMWQELIAPQVIVEIVSGDGREERDDTPLKGKFWIYERVLRTPLYFIFDPADGSLEGHRLEHGLYRRAEPNSRGHYPVPPLGVELGVRTHVHFHLNRPWLRFFDEAGNLLPTFEETAEQERQRAEQERQRAEQERQRAERLQERLRQLGVDPNGG